MNSLALIGAGTMGAGIAQVAVSHGWTVELMDVDDAVSRAAIDGIIKRLDRNVEKGRMTTKQRDAAAERLLVATCADCIAECDVILEAIVEDMDIKVRVLSDLLPAMRDDAIVATNTSSLSITELGARLGASERTVGMHFFNPAPLMKLVEVVAGRETDPAVADRVAGIAQSWGKVVARAADVPGFIVNHVARPYYLEAFRIVEDGLASPDVVDNAAKTHAKFRMGPLELTDLIGQDVNVATTRSVWEQLDKPPLLHPSALQESLVERGNLGRKTGVGVYDHGVDPQSVAIDGIDLKSPSRELIDPATAFARAATGSDVDPRDAIIIARILGGLIVQAGLALERGVASAADIDTALTHGVNYPRGPFEWAESIGHDLCMRWLNAMNATVDDARFAPPAFLKHATQV